MIAAVATTAAIKAVTLEVMLVSLKLISDMTVEGTAARVNDMHVKFA